MARNQSENFGALKSGDSLNETREALYIGASVASKPPSSDMKRRSQHFLVSLDLTYIADTLIFEFGEIATICGSRISSAEV